jgi:hypothetical protein
MRTSAWRDGEHPWLVPVECNLDHRPRCTRRSQPRRAEGSARRCRTILLVARLSDCWVATQRGRRRCSNSGARPYSRRGPRQRYKIVFARRTDHRSSISTGNNGASASTSIM